VLILEVGKGCCSIETEWDASEQPTLWFRCDGQVELKAAADARRTANLDPTTHGINEHLDD
jgi:hypothetical protein